MSGIAHDALIVVQRVYIRAHERNLQYYPGADLELEMTNGPDGVYRARAGTQLEIRLEQALGSATWRAWVSGSWHPDVRRALLDLRFHGRDLVGSAAATLEMYDLDKAPDPGSAIIARICDVDQSNPDHVPTEPFHLDLFLARSPSYGETLEQARWEKLGHANQNGGG